MKTVFSYVVYRMSYIVLAVIVLLAADCHAQAISSKRLIERANALDGKVVVYKGELVAAILNRGEHSWVNLNDGYNAIGVWCNSVDLKDIKFIGGYKITGDLLLVNGIFHRACPEHGGELDIHADTIKIAKQGFRYAEGISRFKIDLSIALFLSALLIVIIFRKRL